MTGTTWQGVPQPNNVGASMKADLDQAMMQVNPNNVLDVRRAVLTEAEDLREFVRLNGQRMKVGLCGSDPVSPIAAQGFNEKIDAHIEEVIAYVRSLVDAGQQLARAAREYGHTEAEITASFTSRQA
jgi:hypothetical protein